jgi:hypothetical protein
MSTLKMQVGESLSADFEEQTWTLEMQEDFSISAGEFAVIPKEKFDRLIIALRGITSSMAVHPDCTRGSEFVDMVSRSRKALAEVL